MHPEALALLGRFRVIVFRFILSIRASLCLNNTPLVKVSDTFIPLYRRILINNCVPK
jgi:hypothetical protein